MGAEAEFVLVPGVCVWLGMVEGVHVVELNEIDEPLCLHLFAEQSKKKSQEAAEMQASRNQHVKEQKSHAERMLAKLSNTRKDPLSGGGMHALKVD